MTGEDGLFGASEVHVLNGELCVIGGHKGLYSVCSDAVVVRQRRCRVSVSGRDLAVASADESEIYIRGTILSVQYIFD